MYGTANLLDRMVSVAQKLWMSVVAHVERCYERTYSSWVMLTVGFTGMWFTFGSLSKSMTQFIARMIREETKFVNN